MADVDSILFRDPSGQIELSFDGKTFDVQTNKKSFIGSRVSYSDVILHSFKVPTTTSDDELKSSVEIKMYEHAGLDLQKKYKITYIKKNLDFEENFLVEAFAIEVDKITKSLSGVLKNSKHIDFLALPFLSFTTLYKNKIIAPKNDLFIYIDESEAFISIYKDGKYLSTKSIMNLEEISKKLDNVGIEISPHELKEHLTIKGLDSSLYERGESVLYNELEAQFSNILTKINDIVVYNRSVFGFEHIDRIFLTTQSGRIKGIKEFIHNFGFNDVEIYDFNLFKQKSEKNFFENIVTSYIYDKMSSKDFSHNVTIFKREPSFYKKESGQILSGAFFIMLLSFLYVGFLSFQNTELEKQKDFLQESHDAMKKTQASYKQKINNLNKELKEISDKEEKLKIKSQNIANSIDKLENLNEMKTGYSDFVLKVNSILAKYSLATTKISLSGQNEMSVEIIAEYSKRDNITKFMEDLIDNGFIGITTDEIKSDKDIYMSKIEVKR